MLLECTHGRHHRVRDGQTGFAVHEGAAEYVATWRRRCAWRRGRAGLRHTARRRRTAPRPRAGALVVDGRAARGAPAPLRGVARRAGAARGRRWRVAAGAGGASPTRRRPRLFRGFNVVAKLPPFLPRRDAFDPAFSLVAEDIAALESLGSNAVRLLVSWPGVEPARGSYNDTYLDELEAIVNDLGAAGMHTLLDFHQDVYSPFFCGNGFPDWATHVRATSPSPTPQRTNTEPLHSPNPYAARRCPATLTRATCRIRPARRRRPSPSTTSRRQRA